ncbi:MAG: aspartate:alanine exchanger family transporter [Planctomycetota bacterium]
MDSFPRFYELLQSQPVLTLFLLLGSGYLIARIRIGSLSLGPVAGVLFAGLFLGHHGFSASPGAQAVGFALFIFSVGYQAGPRFFDVLMTDGLKYFVLALVIALTGFALATAGARLLDVAPGTSAGLLAGGLTSSPTLAAAQEAVRTGAVAPPEGFSADDVIGNITTGYAITYIFGLAGLILIIKLMPGLLGIKLETEARRFEQKERDAAAESPVNVGLRAYRVTREEITHVPLKVLRERYWDQFAVLVARRDGELIRREDVDDEWCLRLGDEVYALGNTEFFTDGIAEIGEEISPEFDTREATKTAQVVVSSAEAVGKKLAELEISRKYGVLVTDLRRMRLPVPRSPDVEIRRGDVLTVTGPSAHIDLLGNSLGHVERDVVETDMLTFAFGICAGVILGLLSVSIAGIDIGLGSAGGLLAAGLIIGLMRSVRPTFGRLPASVRWFLMEFGLWIFMAGVGIRAGQDIVETFVSAGPTLIGAGVVVTVVPVLVGYLVGRKVLGIEPVLLFGAITGAMTSGASLSIVTAAAKSDAPALGYTGTYAFANVLLTIAGSLILLI